MDIRNTTVEPAPEVEGPILSSSGPGDTVNEIKEYEPAREREERVEESTASAFQEPEICEVEEDDEHRDELSNPVAEINVNQSKDKTDEPEEPADIVIKNSKIVDEGKSIINTGDLSLVKRRSMELELFKTPTAPTKKRKVLEEDKYAQELEKIIQRDFFPDLEKLKAQNAYLNAVENNDIHMLRELYSKYSLGKTPRVGRGPLSTPSTFETPVGLQQDGKGTPASSASTPTHLPMESPNRVDDDDRQSVTSSGSSKKSAKSLSLNSYLDTYTSEDNQSFQEMMEDSERKHRIKFSWLYDKEKQHGDRQKAALALPSIEKQAEEYAKPFEVDTWSYRNKNYVMYVPDGAPLTPEEQVELAKKRTEVLYQNTRFQEAPFKSDDLESSKGTPVTKPPSNKIGVDGKEVDTNTPKVGGYGFVRTPSPSPGVEESPYMTWGEIEGSPFRLDGGDTPVPSTTAKPYRMLEQTKRERIAIELTEKVSERYRDKKLKAIEAARNNLATPSPRPKSVMDRLSSMSPAARKLAIKSRIGSGLVGGDKALRASYTPSRTPGSTRSGLATPTPKSVSRTPSKTPTPGSGSSRGHISSSSTLNITDDLLNLPQNKKRPGAAEFF